MWIDQVFEAQVEYGLEILALVQVVVVVGGFLK